MSNSVARLKELLFEREVQTLDELARRVEVVADNAANRDGELSQEIRRAGEVAAQDRDALSRRIDEVMARAGSDERFRASVATVLDGALRDAEVARHAELSGAMAPLVVKTIKAEIANSRDELVDILYPMTGHMVKAYVASAMRDLVAQINRRMVQNPVMLRLRALASGRSVAELAMAQMQRLAVDELYLIRRGTGELIAHWEKGASGAVTPGEVTPNDQVVSGILAAINDVASEAFKTDGSSLRRIDLGTAEVFLRASPAHLLAAKCSGTAPVAVERLLDDEFLAAIERLHELDGASGDEGPAARTLLAKLAARLEARLSERQDEAVLAGGGASALKWIAAAIVLPLLAWFAWGALEDYHRSGVAETARRIVDTSADLRGYPSRIAVAPWGRSLTLTGLAPTQGARDKVIESLRASLPGTEIADQMAVVAGNSADAAALGIDGVRRSLGALEGSLFKTQLARSLEQTGRRMRQLEGDLGLLQTLTSPPDAAVEGKRSLQLVRAVQTEMARHRKSILEPATGNAEIAALAKPIGDLAMQVDEAADRLSRVLVPPSAPRPGTARPAEPARDIAAAADDLTAAADRLATMSSTILHATIAAYRSAAAAVTPSPRARLERWIKENAVFFANGTDYRQPARTETELDELAALMKQAGLLVRVVGYTDERGTVPRNVSLAQQRADKVLQALAGRGVPSRHLVAVGRQNAADLSPTVGSDSPSRRVEFEIAFAGEGGE